MSSCHRETGSSVTVIFDFRVEWRDWIPASHWCRRRLLCFIQRKTNRHNWERPKDDADGWMTRNWRMLSHPIVSFVIGQLMIIDKGQDDWKSAIPVVQSIKTKKKLWESASILGGQNPFHGSDPTDRPDCIRHFETWEFGNAAYENLKFFRTSDIVGHLVLLRLLLSAGSKTLKRKSLLIFLLPDIVSWARKNLKMFTVERNLREIVHQLSVSHARKCNSRSWFFKKISLVCILHISTVIVWLKETLYSVMWDLANC